MELESTKRGISFAKYAATLTREKVQNQVLRLREKEAACVAAEAAWEAAESSVRSLTPLELSLQVEVGQLARRVREHGALVARMHQEYVCMKEDVLFERDGLQARFNSTASQFLGS